MAGIETIIGDLRETAQFEPGTFQHWDELSRDQISDASLRTNAFYVADFPLYTARRGKPVFALARHTKEHPNNLVLVHLFDEQNSSYNQLIQTGHFRPNPDEAQVVLDAADTLKMEMSGLRLSGNDRLYRFLRIRTKDGFVGVGDDKYTRPNEVEQALIQRVGYTEEFLDMLGSKPHNIEKTRVYVLNSDYVRNEVGEGFVGRVAWRDNFNFNANALADDRSVDDHGGLRGVRCEVVPAGDAPEKLAVPEVSPEVTIARCYDALLADPRRAVAALDEQRAAGLSRILRDYLITKAQYQ